MELFVAILIVLGFTTPDAANAMSDAEVGVFVASNQPVIQQASQDPWVMQQANIYMPALIDRTED